MFSRFIEPTMSSSVYSLRICKLHDKGDVLDETLLLASLWSLAVSHLNEAYQIHLL